MFEQWDRYTLPDLAQFFHIDGLDDATLARPWRWLHAHLLALLDIPDSRLARALDR